MDVGRVISTAAIVLLIVAVAGTGYWGYQEHQDKNSVLIKAENNYQRAFHQLNTNMSNLEDELGKALGTNSGKLLGPCMVNVWRVTSEAQSNIGQLPMAMSPFQQTEQFLAELSDYTYEIGMRSLDEEPLSDEEWNELQTMHQQSKDLEGKLRSLQRKVMNDGLRWMDIEMEIAAEQADMENGLVNGLRELDEQVQGYMETEGDASNDPFGPTYEDLADAFQGEPIDEAEARHIISEHIDDADGQIEVSDNGNEDDIAYHIEVQRDNSRIDAEVSKKGGHVLWWIDSRDIEETQIGLHDAQQNAEEFLQKQNIENMIVVESDQYDNVGVFDFVEVMDDARIYPRVIHIKVALDNGDILGYEAEDYVVREQTDFPEVDPHISIEEAEQSVNGHFTLMEEHLSIIETEENEYMLCYELMGTIENDTYRIFVNAENGEEERVEKMKRAQSLLQ